MSPETPASVVLTTLLSPVRDVVTRYSDPGCNWMRRDVAWRVLMRVSRRGPSREDRTGFYDDFVSSRGLWRTRFKFQTKINDQGYIIATETNEFYRAT